MLMLISERGTLGDFQLGQVIVCRTMRPILESLNIEHYAIERQDDCRVHHRPHDQAGFCHPGGSGHDLSPLLTSRGNKKNGG